jgi:hypothetical protein
MELQNIIQILQIVIDEAGLSCLQQYRNEYRK